jgi:hypothetical protein
MVLGLEGQKGKTERQWPKVNDKCFRYFRDAPHSKLEERNKVADPVLNGMKILQGVGMWNGFMLLGIAAGGGIV